MCTYVYACMYIYIYRIGGTRLNWVAQLLGVLLLGLSPLSIDSGDGSKMGDSVDTATVQSACATLSCVLGLWLLGNTNYCLCSRMASQPANEPGNPVHSTGCTVKPHFPNGIGHFWRNPYDVVACKSKSHNWSCTPFIPTHRGCTPIALGSLNHTFFCYYIYHISDLMLTIFIIAISRKLALIFKTHGFHFHKKYQYNKLNVHIYIDLLECIMGK